MKIVFLCKRCPQGRDLITRPYGRFYYLPSLLAEHGHQVHLVLLSYKLEPSVYKQNCNFHLHSISALPWGPGGYVKEAKRIASEIHPGWIVGFSDTWYGILAEWLARQSSAKSIIDAYDNYESYIPWCKPLHWAWRKALSRATTVTAVGPGLANLLTKNRPGMPVEVLPMATDPEFVPMDKKACRQSLGLPTNKKLIGYCGSIHPTRGLKTLFEAFSLVKNKLGKVELILTGRKSRSVSLPSFARWIGYLPDDKVPAFINSMDVLTVMNKQSSFGNHSYPAKLYEAMACEVPVVAASTLATEWILKENKDLLFIPGDAADLSLKILTSINYSIPDYGPQKGWPEIATSLDQILRKN
ncbi:MAG: glycosyltransferase family 4 protein [Desulfofustis sp. PB-SRB1]|nr:glycosyltransferase family 4 protein [Desulfofustis sp. PB-SRB1]MBM1001874.1 glycosyltransferase family 4 protein [Desulfofustis sp. PB-SRB1]